MTLCDQHILRIVQPEVTVSCIEEANFSARKSQDFFHAAKPTIMSLFAPPPTPAE